MRRITSTVFAGRPAAGVYDGWMALTDWTATGAEALIEWAWIGPGAGAGGGGATFALQGMPKFWKLEGCQ